MFKLEVAPEFTASVDIPIPGNPSETVNFVFNHLERDEFDALAESIGAKKITLDDAVRRIVKSWTDPNVEFSAEALTKCFQIFPGSPSAIWFGYREALIQGQRKN